MSIPKELQPYFEFTFSNCFAICSFCGLEQDAVSKVQRFSDDWYLELAAAIKAAGWVIPERQVAACPSCAAQHGFAMAHPR